ncbi:HD domain-containing protein [Rothia dentocariosa]|uniref:HD domain-containing protein n=2 Tax=Rothia dentocariosa TaxID=2047 RepID=UPI0024472282|nr:HD domain-containing protein [Rothia dentocariosa]
MNSYFKEMIRLADSIADNAHLGQVDKNGWPYISHPRRVAFKVREIAPKELRTEAQIVALLHDTVEDTEVTLPYLARYFSARIIDAVDALTKRPHEPLESSMARVRANEIALWVKRADIADNTDPERVSHLDEDTRKRLAKKYSKSLRFLGVTENM